MQNVVEMRAKQLNIRLSDEEADRLERVARHYGLNAAGVIRFLLKREDDAIGMAAGRPASAKAAMWSEAEHLVMKAQVQGVRLLVSENWGETKDPREMRFALTDGVRIETDLDLVGVEKSLARWRRPKKR